jgi:hypothetical protein
MDKILMRRQVFILAAMLTLTSAVGGDVWAGPGGTNGSRGFLKRSSSLRHSSDRSELRGAVERSC